MSARRCSLMPGTHLSPGSSQGGEANAIGREAPYPPRAFAELHPMRRRVSGEPRAPGASRDTLHAERRRAASVCWKWIDPHGQLDQSGGWIATALPVASISAWSERMIF